VCNNEVKTADVSGKGNPKPLKIQRFQDMQLAPFQQSAKKTRSFFSGFQDSEPAAPIGQGCNRTGGNEVVYSEAIAVTDMGYLVPST